MSVPLRIPIDAQPVIIPAQFQAVFNAITPGRYDFTQTAANQDVEILNLEKWAVYVIERYNFRANIAEDNYGEAIDDTNSLPDFQLKLKSTKQQIFPKKQPLINYNSNLEVRQPFYTQNDLDFLMISYRGLFSQVAGMAGLLTMKTYLQINIYKIMDVQWIKEFYAEKGVGGYQLKGGGVY